jgi:phosphoserine aminotransferase
MASIAKPAARPKNPRFSTGPTAKRPGWSPGVDVLAWESFGQGWVADVIEQLGIVDARAIDAPYGDLPDLRKVDFDRDVVFTWNGTTSGVRVPDGAWIASDRAGLTICDATSAAFAQPLPFDKLDVVTYSWQKVLGGEAQHGMLILSPRAAARLASHKPAWPIPKLFRLTAGGKLTEGIFSGEPINTPSMLCVEDYLDALAWADSIGGLDALIARADANTAVISNWVARTPWIDFLARDPSTRSNTSVCLVIVDPTVTALAADDQARFARSLTDLLEAEEVGFDLAPHRDAPPGIRVWCGATVEKPDLEALLPWLDWAFEATKANLRKAA